MIKNNKLTSLDQQRVEFALRLGDDALILGQRLCEWCGHAPSTEIDLALSNLGLDLLGQARLFLTYAGECEGAGRDEDRLAYFRDVLDFKNCLLTEQPNGDFAHTMARHFLFTTWQELMLRRLAVCSDETLSAIARKSVKEISYHATTASEWVIRLGDGTDESRTRMIDGLDWTWRFVDELFLLDEGIEELCSHIGFSLTGMRADWDRVIAPTFSSAGLTLPAPRRGITGGRNGHHTEHLGHLLAEMQYLQRAYPGAQW